MFLLVYSQLTHINTLIQPVGSRTDNVAGVKLPVFLQRETGVDASKDNLGLTGRLIV